MNDYSFISAPQLKRDPLGSIQTFNTMTSGGVVLVAVRAVAGIAAVACLFAGLWIVFSRVTLGLALIGLGIVLGVVFGRVPARTRDAG